MQAKAKALDFLNAVQTSNDTSFKSLSDINVSDPFIKKTASSLKGATFSAGEVKSKDGAYVVSVAVKNSSSIKSSTLTVKNNKITVFVIKGATSASAIMSSK